jgi:hypoxanthine-DNA glycosylase
VVPHAARCFAPIAAPDACVLVLGSLPGRVSLERGEYYAQPQNSFWKIMGRLLHFEPGLPYARREQCLVAARIAVWDVCAAAVREGSLDSAIQRSSVVSNDFASFLRDHPRLESICFNGATAADLYSRLVLPTLTPSQRKIARVVLPSTSPAHASLRFDAKLARWAVLCAAPLPITVPELL